MPLGELLDLARFMAAPEHDLCLLAEGNVSARGEDGQFWVKGSGQEMASMTTGGFSRVDGGRLLELLDSEFADDVAIREALNSVRLEGPNPSTETFMHGFLLAEEGVRFVAHGHPTAVLALVCLRDAREWAERRMFPDEIVCCGPATCFVPYVAPGLDLARSIRQESLAFRERYGIAPKLYWLENHGMIVTGGTAREVRAGCLMAVKAARVLLGALQTRRDVKWLTDEEVDHIFKWPDEHARQRALFGSSR